MKISKLRQLMLCCAALFWLSGCVNSITRNLPLMQSPPRAFEEKKFDSKQWRDGDAQTRGEMVLSLYRERYEKSSPNDLTGKTPTEVLRLLGEPDKKTRGNCCYVRHAPEREVWLYKIRMTDESKPELKEHAFQIYFTEDGKTVEDFTYLLGNMDEKPVYIPNIG